MPAISFKCSAGVIPIKECLQKCPIENDIVTVGNITGRRGRCLTIPTLIEVGYSRDYSGGKFSTTLLTAEPRQAFIQLTMPYPINPRGRGFPILGSRCHRHLEATAKLVDGLKAEHKISGELATSMLDLLQPINENQWLIADYKTVGTYTVVKMLEGDYSGYDYQLNHYRLQCLNIGLDIPELWIEYIARDYGTKYAKEVPENMGMIPVPVYNPKEIADWFECRDESLKMYLAHDEMPPLCEDRWANDRRCKEYCDGISSVCPHGMKYIEAKAKREASKNG